MRSSLRLKKAVKKSDDNFLEVKSTVYTLHSLPEEAGSNSRTITATIFQARPLLCALLTPFLPVVTLITCRICANAITHRARARVKKEKEQVI